MNVVVQGLWHLGCVTAGCLAAAGHRVVGLDFDADLDALRAGKAPLFEPGLDELLAAEQRAGRLSFTSDAAEALRQAEVLWVAYDTPVDDDDVADVPFVLERVRRCFPHLPDGAVVLVSSQVPVGTTGELQREFAAAFPGRRVSFAYSPENLRLGKALEVFQHPDRTVVGAGDDSARRRITELLAPFAAPIEWMSVASAEMVKHALNAFLAVSVTYANEIATLCEVVGADAKEVERGLKSESRIGPKAYLSPGTAFAGGTLARDVEFLNAVSGRVNRSMHLLTSVKKSNDAHRRWTRNKLDELLGGCRGRTVAVWGLTYKPGTSTLRRSSAVELCHWLVEQGAEVRTHDPAIGELPGELPATVRHCRDPLETVHGADALVLATPWPDYQNVVAGDIARAMSEPRIIDPTRFFAKVLVDEPRIQYATIGRRAA
jgi:UDPglucose 6-dehydrogenase